MLRALHKDGLGFTVDMLGETTISQAEAQLYYRRYFSLIDTLADQVDAGPKMQ